MSTRVVDQVDDWTEESFSGGYRELHELADRDFSGVVRAGGAELYMTRGVVVGVRMGAIDDFEDASGTLYEAPADALPLLAIMQEQDVDVRAKYYSEKTSIAKVDGTLSDGGFTGYIELSENVLSGDYYLVYHAGKSMSVAYVGEAGKLLQGDEAFETADDEVGIFKVRQVDIDPIEIPEPAGPAPTTADPEPEESGPTQGGAVDSEPDDSDAVDQDSEPAATAEAGGVTTEDSDTAPAGEAGGATAEDSETAPAGGVTSEDSGTATAEAAGGTATEESEPVTDNDSGRSTTTESSTPAPTERTEDDTTPADSTATEPAEQRDRGTERSGTTAAEQTPTQSEPGRVREESDRTGRTQTTESTQTADPAHSDRAGQPTERRGGQHGQTQPRGAGGKQPQGRQTTPQRTARAGTGADLETKSIPSIDPAHTSIPEETPTESTVPRSGAVEQPDSNPRGQQVGRREPPAETPQEPAAATDTQTTQSTETPEPNGTTPPADQADPQPTSVDSEQLSELESELEQKEETIDQLESELDSATEERDELQSELDAVEAERDELASEVERLETELRRLEDELGAAANAERRITSEEALAGTDIFVRYRSKGKATLKKAHGGSTRKEEVNENLRLEKHTQFDADSVSVGGQSYEEFLEETLEFQFVRWVVRELLFEIRDTGHEKALRNLYDVLPLVDRAELSGVVEVTYTEDGQETQSQESFDVVLRDRMGHPLLAANLNDSRDATTEAMMERLITSAERVGQANDDFSAAFLVTESFFDPGALEVTSDATQGGLLSRDKRKSFVNLSRKQGYHLCLVEARSENFHLAVPEL